MEIKLTPGEWIAGKSEQARAWVKSCAQSWDSGGAEAYWKVYRQARAQDPGAIFRQPAERIEEPPSAGKYFTVPQAPAPTGRYFNVPGSGEHRRPPKLPARSGAIAEMGPGQRMPKSISGAFCEIINPELPIVWGD